MPAQKTFKGDHPYFLGFILFFPVFVSQLWVGQAVDFSKRSKMFQGSKNNEWYLVEKTLSSQLIDRFFPLATLQIVE